MNTLRLLSEFHAGSLTLADTWRAMLAPATAETVLELAAEAGRLGDAARTASWASAATGARRQPPTTLEMAEAVGAVPLPRRRVGAGHLRPGHRGPRAEPSLETLVASLVPIYFGRVGSFVIENRNVTTDQAEERVERQAREFELLKPYLVERWRALPRLTARPGRPTGPSGLMAGEPLPSRILIPVANPLTAEEL